MDMAHSRSPDDPEDHSIAPMRTVAVPPVAPACSSAGAVASAARRRLHALVRGQLLRSRLGQWVLVIRRVRESYRQVCGRAPALLRPRRFTEKMQWRKLFELDPRFAILSDKLAVRDFVAARIGSGRQADVLWAGNDADAIPFDRLAPPYVLKSTHAAGQTIIVRDPAALDVFIDTYETKVGPRNGAHVVAHAWRDEEFHRWLLDDATAAIASLGYSGRQGEHMKVVENTPGVHNLIVCTLCSCYPWSVLGLPPTWYKSAPYRARAVKDPRGVLQEFGVELPQTTEIRIWDSTAEVRYLVLPQRPAGTERLSERELAGLVTRDSMIGTGLPKSA